MSTLSLLSVHRSRSSLIYNYHQVILFRHSLTHDVNYVLFFRMIIATVVFQLLMVGVIGLKQSFAPSALLLPLPVITVLFYFFILQHYIRPAANLSLQSAHALKDPAPIFVQVSWVCLIGEVKLAQVTISLRIFLKVLSLRLVRWSWQNWCHSNSFKIFLVLLKT